MRERQSILLLNNVTPVTVTSSTDATPIVVTATAHGFQTGQRVMIYGHTTNVAANGIFVITRLTANTFSLQDELSGASIVGSGAGAGSSGIALLAPPHVRVTDFRNIILQFGTTGTATTTVKLAGSMGCPAPRIGALAGVAGADNGDTPPSFGGTVSPTNPYTFLQGINLDTAATINGATGIVVAGTDLNLSVEINVNALEWFTLVPISWTAGAITARLLLTDND